MDEKMKNKMDDMEMDKVSGGKSPKPPWIPNHTNDNANSMAANVDENGTVNSMAANVDIDKTQNTSGWLVP